MIEKKIHYCWFGNKPLPKDAVKCIKSWKKYFPDYEIIQWNEKNYDINFNNYAKQAYENKKFAFFTDVARLDIIYKQGGIYFDVDVEVIKPYDDIIKHKAFFGLGINNYLSTGLGFGAEKGNPLVKKLLDDYNHRNFVKPNGDIDLTPCPHINSVIFKNEGFELNGEFEEVNGVAVYPKDYFDPLEVGTGKLKKSKNTHSIHWYMKSWMPIMTIIRSKITKPFHILFGTDCFSKLKKGDNK